VSLTFLQSGVVSSHFLLLTLLLQPGIRPASSRTDGHARDVVSLYINDSSRHLLFHRAHIMASTSFRRSFKFTTVGVRAQRILVRYYMPLPVA
jgi:hypothetical protein